MNSCDPDVALAGKIGCTGPVRCAETGSSVARRALRANRSKHRPEQKSHRRSKMVGRSYLAHGLAAPLRRQQPVCPRHLECSRTRACASPSPRERHWPFRSRLWIAVPHFAGSPNTVRTPRIRHLKAHKTPNARARPRFAPTRASIHREIPAMFGRTTSGRSLLSCPAKTSCFPHRVSRISNPL